MTLKIRPPIPKRIRIGQKAYSIEIVEAMLDKRLAGEIDYHERRIKVGLRNGRTGRLLNPAFVQDTFWHEMVHAILDDMDADELNRNEKFVDAFASRLAKAIRTARF